MLQTIPKFTIQIYFSTCGKAFKIPKACRTFQFHIKFKSDAM